MKRSLALSFTASLCLLAVAGCASMRGSPPIAVATLQPLRGNAAHGTVSFEQKGLEVIVDAHLTDLVPGAHGIDIHEIGDCSAPDAQGAGPDFNPSHKLHGGPPSLEHQAGDLGNLIAQADGTAALHLTVPAMQLSLSRHSRHSILGRSVVVHASLDDMTSQPSGNSGKPIACGVIRLK